MNETKVVHLSDLSSKKWMMPLKPEQIKEAKKKPFVLADFGNGWEPAAWSEMDERWNVAHLESDWKAGKRWFETDERCDSSMLAWVPVHVADAAREHIRDIERFVSVLKAASEYMLDTKGDHLLSTREYDQRLDEINAALKMGKARLLEYRHIQSRYNTAA